MQETLPSHSTGKTKQINLKIFTDHYKITSMNRISKLIVTIRKYVSILKWIIRDLFIYFRWSSIKALGSGIIGLSALASTIGFTIYYLKLLENDKKILIFDAEFYVRSSPLIFSAFTVLILFSMIVSSLLQYYSIRTIYDIRKNYEIFCAKRALNIITSSFDLKIPNFLGLTEDKSLLRIIRGDSSYCGRIVQMVLEGITPGFTFIVALCPLLVHNWALTVCISLFLIFSTFFHFKNNVHAANMSSLKENEMGNYTREFVNLIRQIINLGLNYNKKHNFLDQYFMVGATQRYWYALQSRRVVTEKGKLISNIFNSLIFFIVIGILGTTDFPL